MPVALVALSLLACGPTGLMAQTADDTPIVVLREDDCRSTWRVPFAGLDGLSGLQYGKQKHIPITWAIITYPAIYWGDYNLTWAELKDYLDTAGGEAASHSHMHARLENPEQYIDELGKRKQFIEQYLPGYSCTTFLQPGTWRDYALFDEFSKLDNAVGQAIHTNYQQSLAYVFYGWLIGSPYYRHGMRNTYSLDYDNGANAPAAMSLLDIVAATPGAIFILSCHGIQESGGTHSQEVQADLMKAVMDRLAELRDAGRVRLMGLHDAFHAQLSADINHIPDSGFEACSPGDLNPIGPWTLHGNATISDGAGTAGSRCAKIIGASYARCASLVLPPGVYELSWHQKIVQGSNPDTPVYVITYSTTTPNLVPVVDMNYPAYRNSGPDWELKRAPIEVPELYSRGDIYMSTGNGGVRAG